MELRKKNKMFHYLKYKWSNMAWTMIKPIHRVVMLQYDDITMLYALFFNEWVNVWTTFSQIFMSSIGMCMKPKTHEF